MNKWITILTFTYPHEAHIIRTKLASEGIDTFIRDELTTQVNNFYSNAIGGVKLQVRSEDYDEAFRVLSVLGYIREEHHHQNQLVLMLDKLTGRIPAIGAIVFPIRILIIVALFIVIAVILFSVFTLPGSWNLH
jgi:cytochrome bd-type quinol oxidase subunit 1